MKTSERFNKAIDALYNAFFNETLVKGSCHACAVGNIVVNAQGGTYTGTASTIRSNVANATEWSSLFVTCDKEQEINIEKYPEKAKRLQELTGYSAKELAMVEYAFECATEIMGSRYPISSKQEILEDQYKGLCAVFDVLLELEGIQNDGHKEKLKEHPKLQLV